MSEFVKNLEHVARGNEQPIGFGSKNKEKNNAMLIIARIRSIEGSVVNEAVEGGVDALLFDIENPVSKLEMISKISSSMRKVPWGMCLKGNDGEQIEKIGDAGCDFVVMTTDVSAQLLLDDKMGKMLEVDTSFVDSLAEAISEISVDALLLTDEFGVSPLTIGRLLNYHRVSSCSGKMVVAQSPQDIDDIDVLFEAGVRGVIVSATVEGRGTDFKKIKDKIQKVSGKKK